MHQARDSAVIGSLCLELHKLCREKNAEFRILQFHYTQSVRLQKTLSVWLLASENSARLWRAVDWYVLTGHNSRFSPALSHGNVNRNESSLASFDIRENEFSLKQTYKLARLKTRQCTVCCLFFIFKKILPHSHKRTIIYFSLESACWYRSRTVSFVRK